MVIFHSCKEGRGTFWCGDDEWSVGGNPSAASRHGKWDHPLYIYIYIYKDCTHLEMSCDLTKQRETTKVSVGLRLYLYPSAICTHVHHRSMTKLDAPLLPYCATFYSTESFGC